MLPILATNLLGAAILCSQITRVISCSDCSRRRNLTEKEEIRLKIEWDKIKILNALKLSAPPNLTEADTRNLNVLPPGLSRSRGSEEDSEESEDIGALKTVFVLGSPLPSQDSLAPACAANPKVICLSFSLQPDVAYKDVSGGLLWVRTETDSQAPSTSIIQVLEISKGKKRRALQDQDSATSHSVVGRRNGTWVSLNVSSLVAGWKRSRSTKPHFLRISCASCSNSFSTVGQPTKAFLELETQIPKSRNRRNHEELEDCRPDLFSSCCLKRLWVSFEELGAKFKFIIQPDGYWANYCTGNCRYGNTGVYGSVVANSAETRKAKGQEIDENMIPCCAPRKMGSLELIWVKKAHDIRKHVIKDMTVLSCGCDR